MPKQVMLSGYYGFENFGDELILSVLVSALKQWDIQPIILSEHPKETEKTFQVESMPRMELHHIWSRMGEIDAFISGGGGLFQDATGPASPIYYGGLIEMARWRGLPIAFFGQGIGPLNTMLGEFLTKRALSNSDLIAVRDIKSHALVQELIQQKSNLIADPVWAWQPQSSLKSLPKQGIGISIRPWAELGNDGIDQIGEFLVRISNIQNIGVNLIDCQAGFDILPLARLEQFLKSRQIPYHWFSGANVLQGIAQSEAVIAMRFHVALVAAQMNIPLMALSYDPKVRILASHLAISDIPVSEVGTLSELHFDEQIRHAKPESVEDFNQSAENGLMMLQSWLG